MKTIITVILLSLATLSYGQLIEPDKKLHFKAGVLVGGITNATTFAFTKSPKKALLFGMGATFCAGLTKELYDQYKYGSFDVIDLWFTMAGGISVNIPLTMIEGAFTNRKINTEI